MKYLDKCQKINDVKVVCHGLFIKGEKCKLLSKFNSNHMTGNNIVIETVFNSIVIIGKTQFSNLYIFVVSNMLLICLKI